MSRDQMSRDGMSPEGMTHDVRAPRILVAGMGNILRGDDGFGVEVARRLLAANDFPPNVTIVEVGIGGISLVQELMISEGYDVLLIIDAVQRDGAPGRIYVLEAEVPDLADFPELERRDLLADMHYTTPSRAMLLAKALKVLPTRTLIVGCQPQVYEAYEIGLSEPVAGAIDTALEQIRTLLDDELSKANNIT